jgi:phage-related minor tail protein
MPAPEIAVAYVSIVPEIQGFARDLRAQIVGPAADAGDQAGEAAGGGLKEKLKVGAAAAGIAAGAVLVKGIADAIEQADITKKLQAQLGASGKDAARYGKVAGSLYAKGVTENFEQGAEAIRAVVNGGLVKPDATNKQLESIASKMSDVATTFGTDMGMQTQAVSALMKNGLAKNAGEALDVITTGMQKLGPNADDLLDTFQEYPVQLKKLGLDSKTAMGLFSQGLKGGARDTDIIADAMKEFSIRSIDMSTGSRDAYKSLGLDAQNMEKMIGKGGASATKGLDIVLDKLRGIHDPVKREAAAVGLFGTQAEDLGSALFKLDPSKAVAAAGKTDGAAAKLGKTLRSGPIYQIKTFARTLQQDLVEVIGKYLVPALTKAGEFGKAAWAWMKDNQGWLLPFAAGITAIAVAIALYTGVVRTVAAVTKAWAAIQAAFNVVMAMNPLALVALALVGIAAALYVAYQRSETFRNIVQTAMSAVASIFSWLWNTVLKPIFGFLFSAFKLLLTIITVIVVAPIILAVKALGAIFSWLWTNAIKPAIDAIGAAAKWLWDKAIKPVFDFIANKAKWLWNNGIKPAFGFFVGGLKEVAKWAKWLWDNGIKPPFNFIADKAKWLWNKGVKPAFDLLKAGMKKVSDAFKTAKEMIGKQWSKLSDIAKKPINFIIDTVYNKGIVGVWNKVAGAFGAPKLNKFKGFATGGILPGYTPGRDVHLAALSGGEAVMRPEWTRAMGPQYVNSMNALARKGGVGAVQKAMGGGLPAFKDGGIFGWIGSAGSALKGAGSAAWDGIKKGASWLKDTLEASARAGVKKVVNPLISMIPGTSSGFGKMVKGIPNKMVDSIFGYAKTADKKNDAAPNIHYKPGAGVAQWKGVVLKALGMVGQPASLLNTVLRRMNQESGGNPKAINNWDINAKNGVPSKGLMQVIDPTFNAYAGKLRGRGVWDPLANVYASMRYAMSRYGSLSSAYNRTGGYDNGGWLQPGATLSANDSGKPEPVFTSGQWSQISTLANRGMVGGNGGLQPGDTLTLSVDGRTTLEAYVDRRADDRIHKGLVGPASLGRVL